jgi:uncharacterized protein
LRVFAAQGELLLSAAKATYCPAERALFVADVHLGKALSFRALGVPVPGGTTAATLARLSQLLDAFEARTLYVLGDLLHGPAVRDSGVVEQLSNWRRGHPNVRMVLVRGNHDDRAGDPPERCGIEVVDEGARVGAWVLRHHPGEDEQGYVLCGHVHPCYRLRGRADSVRLPAFWLRDRQAILPAFGDFTGGGRIALESGDRVFVTDGQAVHGVPRSLVLTQ